MMGSIVTAFTVAVHVSPTVPEGFQLSSHRGVLHTVNFRGNKKKQIIVWFGSQPECENALLGYVTKRILSHKLVTSGLSHAEYHGSGKFEAFMDAPNTIAILRC